MKIFCQACVANHEFDEVQVERIVYALQAQYAESLVQDHNDSYQAEFYQQFKDKQCWEVEFCLEEIFSDACDSEGYGEHTSGLIESRRAVDGLVGCDECGADAPASTNLCIDCIRKAAGLTKA